MKKNIKFLIIFYIWMFIGVPLGFILKLLNIDNISENYYLYGVLQFIIGVIISLIAIILYHKELKEDFKNIIHNKNYLGDVLKIYVGVLVVSASATIVMTELSNLLHVSLNGSDNNNLVDLLLKSAPVYMAIGTVIVAPFYEETIMRLGLNQGIKNKGVFALFSGIIFGIIHVVDNPLVLITLPLLVIFIDYLVSKKKRLVYITTCIITYLVVIIGITYISPLEFSLIGDINDMIYSILYISLGLYLAIIYKSKNNIFYTIGAHSVTNLISTIFLFFK